MTDVQTMQTAKKTTTRKRAPRKTAKGNQTFGAIKLADLLIPHLKDRFRFCPELDWLEFSGSKWERVTADRVLNVLVGVVKRYTLDLVESVGLDRETLYEVAAFSSGSTQAQAIKIARADPAVATKIDEFDRHPNPTFGEPYRFHCSNGWTIELWPGGDVRPRPTSVGDLNTKVGCAYDPDAEAPLARTWWRRYQPDTDILRFQMEEAMRGLSGMGTERFTAWYGPTAGNGKSTIEMLLTTVAGEYAVKLPVEVLLASSKSAKEAYRNERAQLRAARLVFADEPEDGSRFAVGEIKALTGGAPITARENYCKPVTFVPRIVLVMIANNRPTWGNDAGMERRYVELEWKYRIPPAERREAFKDELCQEASGVLNQLLKHWHGSTPAEIPEAVAEQTRAATRAANPVARFHDEACAHDETAITTAKDIYAAYRQWCDQNGERPYSNKRFGDQFTRLGPGGEPYVKSTSNGTRYHGVAINTDYKASERYYQL